MYCSKSKRGKLDYSVSTPPQPLSNQFTYIETGSCTTSPSRSSYLFPFSGLRIRYLPLFSFSLRNFVSHSFHCHWPSSPPYLTQLQHQFLLVAKLFLYNISLKLDHGSQSVLERFSHHLFENGKYDKITELYFQIYNASWSLHVS